MALSKQIGEILARTWSVMLDNLWLKLISLLMAFTLWFIVTGGTKLEETIQVRHNLERYVPDGWAIATPIERELELRVRGRDDSVAKLLDPGEVNRLVTINVDPGFIQPKKGVQRIELNASNVSLPSGVEVLEVNPSTMLIQIDRIVSQQKPVRLVVSGEPRAGYRLLGKPVVEPATVTVSGAQQLVETIRDVVAAVSLDDRGKDDSVVAVTLQRNPLLSYSVNAVEVALDIVEVNEMRSFTINASNFEFRGGNEGYLFDVDPKQIVLYIEGPTSWINALQPEEIRLSLNRQTIGELNRRTLINFNQSLVTFTKPVRMELVTITANPSEFHLIVTSRQ
jgi:hypothetical protein